MNGKSVIGDACEIRRATELIELGARLQLLESETNLSRERLLRLRTASLSADDMQMVDRYLARTAELAAERQFLNARFFLKQGKPMQAVPYLREIVEIAPLVVPRYDSRPRIIHVPRPNGRGSRGHQGAQ